MDELFTSGETEETQETTEEIIEYEGNVISSNVFIGMGIGGTGIIVSLLVISFLKILRKGTD